MEIQILVEPIEGGGHRAQHYGLGIQAEGATAEQAVERLKQALNARFESGARLMTIVIPGENPWSRVAGMYKDDPYYDEWRQAMADNRQQVENDPDYL